MFEKIKKASVAAVAVLAVVGCVAPPEILTDGGPPTVRRLTAEQYRQSITDIFLFFFHLMIQFLNHPIQKRVISIYVLQRSF